MKDNRGYIKIILQGIYDSLKYIKDERIQSIIFQGIYDVLVDVKKSHDFNCLTESEEVCLLDNILSWLEEHISYGKEKNIIANKHKLHEMIGNLAELFFERKKIAFLPYKASMWDSFESVWELMYYDIRYEVSVIPIPYYDRLESGELGQQHFDIEDFIDIPVCDYHDVEVMQLKWDAVFIHNPYDSYNRVTSVEPKFYSDKLKKITTTLIYIPYFVSGDRVSKGCCVTLGVMNADWVVVQDENIRKQYVEYCKEYNIPATKFLALGSPKFDKVIKSKKEDYIISPEMNNIINGKKVVLYNTSIAAALQNPDEVCGKLRDVINYYSSSKELVLWWRPHPLLEATFQSMIPEHEAEYKRIKNWFINEKLGFYDNTPDMYRAIMYSDCYYGDDSSVAWIYKKTGKPVVYQDMRANCCNRLDKMGMWALAFCIDENKNMWFIHGKLNILCKYNLDKNYVESVVYLPISNMIQQYTYLTMEYVEGKLFLLPCVYEDIMVYDTAEKIWYTIEYPEKEKYKNFNKFSGAVVYDGELYCFPSQYRYIIKISANESQAENLVDIKPLLKQYGINGAAVIDSVVQISNHEVLGLFANTNVCFKYNLKTNDIDLVTIGCKGYLSIAVTDSSIILSDCESAGRIYIYRKDNYNKAYKTLDCAGKRVRNFNGNSFIVDDVNSYKWYIVNDAGEFIYESVGDEPPVYDLFSYEYKSFITLRNSGHVYGFDTCSNMFYDICEDDYSAKRGKIYLSAAQIKELKKHLLDEEIIPELPEITMLDIIKNKKEERTEEISLSCNAIAELIWR